MADITASMIKDLREKTNAGMMDCKKALVETKGDMEQAIDWLRKKGLSAAAKKSGRKAHEGLVAISGFVNLDGSENWGMIELNCETDFAAKNKMFQLLARRVAACAAEDGRNLEKLNQAIIDDTKRTVAEEIAMNVGVIGENLQLRRCAQLRGDVIAGYVHNPVHDEYGMVKAGSIGVLVAITTQIDGVSAKEIGKKVAMHIAASRPESLDISDLDPALIEREKAVVRAQSETSGKSPEVIEKMVEGRIRKFYSEVVLLEQPIIFDGKTTVRQFLKEEEKSWNNVPISIASYVIFRLGEGIDDNAEDVVDDVISVAS